MKILRNMSFAVLSLFILSLSIGISFGDVEAPEILILDYLSSQTKTFQDLLMTKANMIIVTETTCYSCIKELQSMEILRAKYRGEVAVMADFIDRQGLSKVQRYLDYYNFDVDMLLVDESSAIPRKFDVTYIPTLFIFDMDGNLVFRKEGFQEGDESLIGRKVEEIIYAGSPLARAGAEAPPSPGAPSEGKPGGAVQESGQVKKTTGCASSPG